MKYKTKDVTDEMICEAIFVSKQMQPSSNMFPSDILLESHGIPRKVTLSAMERADKRGLIEWGVSLRSAWLTDKGKELLQPGDVSE